MSIADEVKCAILEVDGDNHPDPDKLDADEDMSGFGFNTPQYISLTAKFNNIIHTHKPAGANVSLAQVEACDTVKDCIDLVEAACR